MPRKIYRKSRAKEGVEEGSSQLEVQEICQEQDTHKPQYQDVTQESDLECGKFKCISEQNEKKVFLDFGAGRRSRRLHKQLLVSFFWHPT